MKNFTLLNKTSPVPPGKIFTFVELLLILAIVGILTGLLLPPLLRSRKAAGFASWLKYNEHLNQKPETVVNFNFQEYGYKLNINGIMTPCVENLAGACDLKGFDARKYAGIMVNNPEWLPRGGRWKEKGAMQFNGADQCLYISGSDILDFLRSKNDFTVYLWIYYYSRPSGAVFSKGGEDGGQQYAMFVDDSAPRVIFNDRELRCQRGINAKKWYHIAVVNNAVSGLKLFINGKFQEMSDVRSKTGVDLKNSRRLMIGAFPRAGKMEKENSYSLAACFRGKIDEIVILRRALSPEEINYAYQIGKGPGN